MTGHTRFRCILFDWGGTLMSEDGPLDIPMARWPEVRAIEGAQATLAALAAHHRIGIATNATVSRRDMIELALERVALRRYVTDIFCFTELGVRKESAEFWAAVCETLHLSPAALAMVGDALEPDVLAPRRAGLHAVWFNAGGLQPAPSRPVPTITSLVALPGALATA